MTTELGNSPAVMGSTESPSAKGCGCNHSKPIVSSQGPSCKCKKLRTPRKIHAACGLLLTGFLVLHFSMAVTGLNPAFYQKKVDHLHSFLNHVPGVALVAILLPMLLQCATGLFLVQREGLRYYTGKCDRGGRVRFFLQRWTGLCILSFVFVHFATLHSWGFHLVYRVTGWQALTRYSTGGLFHHSDAFASTAQGFTSLWREGSVAHMGNAIAMLALLAGIISTAFHVANGAWSGASLWKLLTTPKTKLLWRIACISLGVALAVAGSLAWYAFSLAPAARAAIVQ